MCSGSCIQNWSNKYSNTYTSTHSYTKCPSLQNLQGLSVYQQFVSTKEQKSFCWSIVQWELLIWGNINNYWVESWVQFKCKCANMQFSSTSGVTLSNSNSRWNIQRHRNAVKSHERRLITLSVQCLLCLQTVHKSVQMDHLEMDGLITE